VDRTDEQFEELASRFRRAVCRHERTVYRCPPCLTRAVAELFAAGPLAQAQAQGERAVAEARAQGAQAAAEAARLGGEAAALRQHAERLLASLQAAARDLGGGIAALHAAWPARCMTCGRPGTHAFDGVDDQRAVTPGTLPLCEAHAREFAVLAGPAASPADLDAALRRFETPGAPALRDAERLLALVGMAPPEPEAAPSAAEAEQQEQEQQQPGDDRDERGGGEQTAPGGDDPGELAREQSHPAVSQADPRPSNSASASRRPKRGSRARG
jgi:hypothetical protein